MSAALTHWMHTASLSQQQAARWAGKAREAFDEGDHVAAKHYQNTARWCARDAMHDLKMVRTLVRLGRM